MPLLNKCRASRSWKEINTRASISENMVLLYFKLIKDSLTLIVRMAKATKWLQAILDYMKKVKSITSTVFG